MFHKALKEIGFLVGVGIVGIALMFLSGCATRALDLGFVPLPDGSVIQGIQFTSDGQDGPKLAVIETYRSTVKGTDAFGEPVYHETTKVGHYSAGGSGILSDIVSGSARAALYAGGNVGAAAVRRPDKTQTSVITGAVNTAVSTATGAVNTAIDNAVSATADTVVDTEVDTALQSVNVTDGDLRQRGQGNLNINIGDNTNTTSGRGEDD